MQINEYTPTCLAHGPVFYVLKFSDYRSRTAIFTFTQSMGDLKWHVFFNFQNIFNKAFYQFLCVLFKCCFAFLNKFNKNQFI